MTKAEMVDAIAKNAKLTKSQARDALEAFVTVVSSSLKGGKEVRLVGFGSFVPVERKAGLARNPRTGEAIKVPSMKVPKFRAAKALKDAVK